MGCDTFGVLADAAGDQCAYFAKNSDRDRNEPQFIEVIEAHAPAESSLRCTHISIPQVAHVFKVRERISGSLGPQCASHPCDVVVLNFLPLARA
jgi:hypothetical protein